MGGGQSSGLGFGSWVLFPNSATDLLRASGQVIPFPLASPFHSPCKLSGARIAHWGPALYFSITAIHETPNDKH